MMIFTDEIYINRDLTRLVKTNSETKEAIITEAQINTKNLFNEHLFKNMGFQTEILPSNCKFIKHYSDGAKLLVLEDEPQVRTVSFDNDPISTLEFLKINGKYDLFDLEKFKYTRPYKLRLSFPYIVYVILLSRENRYNGMYVFFRLNPITSMNDYLLKPCLPNIDGYYKMCLGLNSNSNGSTRSLTDSTSHILNTFWFNSFNNDYVDNVRDYETIPELTDFFTWAYHTKVDPMFIFSVNWLLCDRYKTLGNCIDFISSGFYESDLLSSLTKTIKQSLVHVTDKNEKIYHNRDLAQSITLYSDNSKVKILSVGDEIEYQNKKYYIESIIHNSFDDKGIVLENSEEKIEVNLSDDKNYQEIIQQFTVINPTSIQIGDNIIKNGDLVQFKDSGNVKVVEKIIKTQDNLHQIKIGKYFYLENCFLKNNLQVLENLIFCNETMEKDKEYFLSDQSRSYMFLNSFFIGKYVDVESDKYNELIVKFKLNNGLMKELYLNQNEQHVLVPKDSLIFPTIYRIGEKIYTNDKKEPRVFLKKDAGLYIQNKSRYIKDDYYEYIICNKEILVKFFKDLCEKGGKTFTIPSVDNYLTYSIGDEVIFINWKNPESMLKIKFITGFTIDETNFYLVLKTDENSEEEKVPLINLTNGTGDFGSIRHACSEIGDLKVGFKVKAKSKVADFPMKDCNEIKAFITDDIEPLVLFSNYRTLPLRHVIDYFKVFQPGTKEYLKTKLSEPNMKIKIQDGDLFKVDETRSRGEKIICFICGRNDSRMSFVQIQNCSTTCASYRNDFNPTSHSSYVVTKNRYGLLLPRVTDTMLKALPKKHGFPTLFSNLIADKNSNFSIRRDWKGEY